MNRSIRVMIIMACLAGAACVIAWSQASDPAAANKQYGESAQQNAVLMKQYSWKMRVEVTVKGDTKPAQIYQMRYDMDGKLQKTALTAPQEIDKKRGIRGLIQKNKMEDFKDWTTDLAELVKEYMTPPPGVMKEFYNKATMTPAADGTAQMSGTSFIHKDDKAIFWVNKDTKVPVRFDFITTLDGDSVEGNVEYRQITNGPQYAARVTVSVPEKDVKAKVECFDFLKQ